MGHPSLEENHQSMQSWKFNSLPPPLQIRTNHHCWPAGPIMPVCTKRQKQAHRTRTARWEMQSPFCSNVKSPRRQRTFYFFGTCIARTTVLQCGENLFAYAVNTEQATVSSLTVYCVRQKIKCLQNKNTARDGILPFWINKSKSDSTTSRFKISFLFSCTNRRCRYFQLNVTSRSAFVFVRVVPNVYRERPDVGSPRNAHV